MKRSRLRALGGLVLVMSCGGGVGPSCGGCSSSSNYSYPSRVMQGTETVDDAVRARLTERGLDFIVANFKEILRSQFPPDPQNPNLSRIQLPSQSFIDTQNGTLDGQICLQGNTAAPPGGCITPAQANKVSAITIDLNHLEDNIVADFITTPEPGVRITLTGLPIGFDGRIHTNVDFLGFFNTDADCDVRGASSAAGVAAGTVGTLDMVVEIFPRVSTSTNECLPGVSQCFMASVTVTDAHIDDVGLTATVPAQCTSGTSPAGCSPSCSDRTGLFCDASHSCYADVTCPDSTGACECTELLCPVYTFGTELLGQIGNFLFGILEPFLDTILTNALNNALDSFNGQPLAFSGSMDVGAFAGGLVPGLKDANSVGFSISPTNAAFSVTCPQGGTASCDERRGMDLLLKAGVEAVHDPGAGKPAPSGCVPLVEGAKFLELYGTTVFETADPMPLSGEFLDPATNLPTVYDLGASLSRVTLNQLGFAIFNGGVLCLGMDSYTIHGLTNGGFSLTVGALDLLTGGRLTQYADPKAPLYLAIAPEEPPVFTLGEGTLNDPHLKLSLKKMHVAIYAWMYERYARLFEVSTDVTVGLNITPDPVTRELTIAVVQGPTIDNFVQVYNELMPDVDFGAILPSLINVALGALLNQDISFNFDVAPLLSDALGGAPIYIVFNGLVTETINGQGEFLNLYLSLSSTNPNPLTKLAVPDVKLAPEVRTWVRGPDDAIHATGMARLTGPLGPLPAEQRYSWQVDFGPWSGFVAPDDDGVLVVRDSKLMLAGRHTVRVRAMRGDDAASRNPDIRDVTVWTDAQGPRVWLTRAEGRVAVRAEDRIVEPDALRMQWALDAEPQGDWVMLRDLEDAELAGDVLVVRVKDPAGNITEERLLLHPGSRATAVALDTTTHAASDGCTCAAPTGSATPLAVALAGLLLAVVRRRRR